MEIVTAVEETPVVVSASGQQLSLLSLPGDKRDGLSVEGYEGFPAEPITFVGDYAIGEVTACIENRQSGCQRQDDGGRHCRYQARRRGLRKFPGARSL